MNTFDDPERPLGALTLTIKTAGIPAVHLTYDSERPIAESAVTVLDQRRASPDGWSCEDVIKDALVFLLLSVRDQDLWPAELRAPCAGRVKTAEAS